MIKDFRVHHLYRVRLDIPCPFDGGFTHNTAGGSILKCSFCNSEFNLTLKLHTNSIRVSAKLEPILLGREPK